METFKDIPWYEDRYQVSDKGNVKSLAIYRWAWKWWYTTQETIRKLYTAWQWYNYVDLHKDWAREKFSIWRLVLLAFVWPSDLQCNHKNWNKLDNRLENLEYCTPKENIKHAWNILGNKKPWVYNQKKIKQCELNWRFIRNWDSIGCAWREVWIDRALISRCCRGLINKTWGFIWKYV